MPLLHLISTENGGLCALSTLNKIYYLPSFVPRLLPWVQGYIPLGLIPQPCAFKGINLARKHIEANLNLTLNIY